MCIMFITDKTKGLPDTETLNHIFTSNPHGGGLAYVYTDDKGKRFIAMEKGIMDKETFVSKVAEHYKKLNADSDYMIVHTRITTSGGTSPKKTHPFKTSTGGFFFQNGISNKVEQLMHPSESDTEWLAKNYKGMDWVKQFDNVSRFVIINPDGTMEMTDNWVKDEQGRYWSNSGFEPYYSRYSTWDKYRPYTYGRGGYVDNECAVATRKPSQVTYSDYSASTTGIKAVLYCIFPDSKEVIDNLYSFVAEKGIYGRKNDDGDMDMMMAGLKLDPSRVVLQPSGKIELLPYEPPTESATVTPPSAHKYMQQLSQMVTKYIKANKTDLNLFYDPELGEGVDIEVKVNKVKLDGHDNPSLYRATVNYSVVYDEVFVGDDNLITIEITKDLKNLDDDMVTGIVSSMSYDQLDDDYEQALAYELNNSGIDY